jgi:Lar family restriction alleviation protein
MSDELKPCPFCGGEAERFTITAEAEVSNIGGDVIACKKCEASTRVFFGEKEGIVNAWNARK